MRKSLQIQLPPMEVASADHRRTARSAAADQLDQSMADLRQAMTDTGWTVDAVAAELSRVLDRTIDRGYCWRLVNNEKPWRQEYTTALPDDLEGRWYAIGAERLGHIVVKPLVGIDAERALIAGFFGVLGRRIA